MVPRSEGQLQNVTVSSWGLSRVEDVLGERCELEFCVPAIRPRSITKQNGAGTNSSVTSLKYSLANDVSRDRQMMSGASLGQ